MGAQPREEVEKKNPRVLADGKVNTFEHIEKRFSCLQENFRIN